MAQIVQTLLGEVSRGEGALEGGEHMGVSIRDLPLHRLHAHRATLPPRASVSRTGSIGKAHHELIGLNQWRRFAKRYEQPTANYLAVLTVAAIPFWF